jgi:hypothetical protein
MVAVTVNVDTQGVDTQALQEYLTFMAMQYIKDKEESSQDQKLRKELDCDKVKFLCQELDEIA